MKLKPLATLVSTLSLFACASVFAETYYFDTTNFANTDKGQNTNGIDIDVLSGAELEKDATAEGVYNPSGDTLYFWYTMPSETTKNYITDSLPVFTDSDTLVFDQRAGNSLFANSRVWVDKNITLGTLQFRPGSTTLATRDNAVITVGTLKISDSNTFYSASTRVTGNLILCGGNLGSTDPRREIMESLYVGGYAEIKSMQKDSYRPAFYIGKKEKPADIDAPDAVFAGGIKSADDAQGASFTYGMAYADSNSADLGLHSVISVNGVSGIVGFESRLGKNGSTVGSLTLVFTNNADSQVCLDGNAITSGNLTQFNGKVDWKKVGGEPITWSFSDAKMALVMKSEGIIEGKTVYQNGVQSFTGDVINFTGGVKMISGGLFLNYNAKGIVDYDGNETAKVSHGVLTLAQASGAQTVFGNANEACGTFVFDSIAVENGGGSIKVLSSRNFDEGSTFVAGVDYDLLQATDGITGAGNINFEFDVASDFVSESAENLYQLISWSTKENFNKEDYKDITVSGSENEGYNFVYDFRADGLYGAYVVVPEPSTYAAIFGLLALGFAIYRRKK